jgi:hypothetical protein
LRGGISPFSGWSYADDHSKIARKASGPTRIAVQSLRHSSLDVGIDLIFGGTALIVIAVERSTRCGKPDRDRLFTITIGVAMTLAALALWR